MLTDQVAGYNFLPLERDVDDHEEVELLLEGYRGDLLEMHLELRAMRGQIEDTKEFINTHQVVV